MQNPIRVPFQRQADNRCGEGWHECMTSAVGMAAMYHGAVASDDAYDRVRERYGATESPMAHVCALQSLGLRATYRNDLTRAELVAELAAGRPVPVGWLHHGPYTAATGGGHWSTAIGTTADGLWIHDPEGDPDLIHGGWIRHGGGECLRFSWRHWGPRWQPEGDGHGWALLIRPTAGTTGAG